MKKNRYLLCLLLCGFMIYFAVPRLSIFAEGAAGIFAIVWLSFALVVIAGNLTALLYSPKKQARRGRQLMQMQKKSRSFH
jgi:hypothetical protein